MKRSEGFFIALIASVRPTVFKKFATDVGSFRRRRLRRLRGGVGFAFPIVPVNRLASIDRYHTYTASMHTTRTCIACKLATLLSSLLDCYTGYTCYILAIYLISLIPISVVKLSIRYVSMAYRQLAIA